MFVTSRVKKDEMWFKLVIADLEFEVLQQVSDSVKSLNQDYNALKNRLNEIYMDSEGKRIRRFLEDWQIGDEKLSLHLW